MDVRGGSLKLKSLSSLALTTMREHKAIVAGIFCSLSILAMAQASVILLVKGFLVIFFETDPKNQWGQSGRISIESLLPESIAGHLAVLEGLTLSIDVIAAVLPIGALIAGIVKSVGSYGYTRFQQEFSFHAATMMRDVLFKRIAGQSYEQLSSASPGSWMSMLINDVTFVQTRLSDIMTSFLRGGVSVIASLVVMFLIHWQSAVITLVIIPIVGFFTGSVGRKIAGFSRDVQHSMQEMAALLLEIRGRFEFMRAQHGEGRDLGRFESLNHSYFAKIIRSVFVRSSFAPALEFLGFLIFSGFIFGIHSGWIAFGDSDQVMNSTGGDVLVQFMIAVAFMVKPLRDIGEQVSRYHETRGALDRCFSILANVDLEVPDATGLEVCQPQGNLQGNLTKNPPGAAASSLKIHRASFTWATSGRRFCVEGLEVPGDRTIAILGPSGSGKSTFLKILAGLVEPREWSANESWLSVTGRSALVPQSPFLFSGSLFDNLTYGNSNVSELDVWRALEVIEAADFIRNLPNGLQASYSPLAANFSGGQIQRLVIARTLLRERHFLLLDEATSALDAATEGEILRRLIDITHQNHRSLLAVTHRLQWLPLFDEIWFVENGSIILRDSFDNLMRTERFARFCASYSELG